MTEIKIYQEVELSLTENLVPTVVHVKQFDHLSRKIRCVLYSHSVEYQIPRIGQLCRNTAGRASVPVQL